MEVVTSKVLEQVAFTAYLIETSIDDDICLEDVNEKYIKHELSRWNRYFLPSLDEEHSGDCTNQCHTCNRCYTERFFTLAKAVSTFI